MRRYSAILILIVAVALILGAVGCGSSQQAGASQPAQGGAQTPQAVMTGAILAADNMTGASGSFDVTVTLTADASKAPAEMKAFVTNPIKISGTFAGADKPEAADVTLSMQLGGQTIDAALKSSGGKSWLQFGGQWYELPADLLGTGGAASTTSTSQPSMADITKLLSDLGIDPTSWIKDLTMVGEEKIDGAAAYHLKGTPDVAKMMTDVIQLMKSPEFTKLMNPSGATTGSTDTASAGAGLGSIIPSPDELQKMQTQIAEAFKNFTVEAWVDKAESFLRKATITAHLTPPAGQDSGGVSAVDVSATFSLKNFNQPVSVQAPASSLPITDLEKAIQANPAMLGPLSGLMGLVAGMGTGSAGSQLDTTTTITATSN